MTHHTPIGNKVVMVYDTGERRTRATCDWTHTAYACKLLDRARYQNDVKRRYTYAARLIAECEALPGFVWIE